MAIVFRMVFRAPALLVAGVLAGCASIGPASVPRDRFDYVASISESWKRQMLLNVVKVRYSDAPVFLDVTSVINAYGIEGTISLTGQSAPVGRAGDSFTNLGGAARFSDHPTITYAPLSGEKFTKGVMTPIPVAGVLALVEGGYPIDLVLRLCVNTVNGMENARGGLAGSRPGDEEFRELLQLMREDQAAGGLRVHSTAAQRDFVLYLRPPLDGAMATRHRRIVGLLGLDGRLSEFGLRYGTRQAGSNEVVLQTRSMMQVLADFASYVEVPEGDVAQGRVFPVHRAPGEERRFPPVVRVLQSDAEPQDAYVAVRYRDRWFWIEDRDYFSKSALTFLMLMFSLTETGPAQAAPVMTVPAR